MHMLMAKLRLFATTTLLGISAICNCIVALADTPTWDGVYANSYRLEGLGPYVSGWLGLGFTSATGLPNLMAYINPVEISDGVYSHEVNPPYGKDGTKPMPLIYMAHVQIDADGQPFVRAELHARVKNYAVLFPYAPHEVMLALGLSNGPTAQQKVKLGEKLPIRYDADLRAGVADSASGVTVDLRSLIQSTSISYTCQVPKSGAPIKRIQLWLSQHPVFAPEASLLLTDTQVVAKTRWLGLSSRVFRELPTRGPWQESRSLEFMVMCEMQDGRKLTGVAMTKIPRGVQ